MKSQRIQGNRVQVLLHLAAWAILLGLPLYNFNRWDVPKAFVWVYYINALINGLIFYSNYLGLIPRFFFGSSRFKYYLSAVSLTVVLFFVSHFSYSYVFENVSRNGRPDENRRPPVEEPAEPGPPPRERGGFRLYGPIHFYNYTFNAFVITIFALGLRVLQRHAQIEKRQKELEKEKLNSELAFLKNQISPHFFFNTLNNIYSLISINTKDSQDAVLKLSRMMRYLLYESEHGETQLSSEIDFMNNYIDLMRLRMTEKVRLDVSFPDKYENMTIPPLLFISIIENAFKHGISYREKSFIQIVMEVSKDLITFRCINSIVKTGDKDSDIHSGIGLENVSKRLNLLFPGRHEFNIEKTDAEFSVWVKISMV